MITKDLDINENCLCSLSEESTIPMRIDEIIEQSSDCINKWLQCFLIETGEGQRALIRKVKTWWSNICDSKRTKLDRDFRISSLKINEFQLFVSQPASNFFKDRTYSSDLFYPNHHQITYTTFFETLNVFCRNKYPSIWRHANTTSHFVCSVCLCETLDMSKKELILLFLSWKILIKVNISAFNEIDSIKLREIRTVLQMSYVL